MEKIIDYLENIVEGLLDLFIELQRHFLRWWHCFAIHLLSPKPKPGDCCPFILLGSLGKPVSLTHCLDSWILSFPSTSVRAMASYISSGLMLGVSVVVTEVKTQACMYPQSQVLKGMLLIHLSGIIDISWITNESIWPISVSVEKCGTVFVGSVVAIFMIISLDLTTEKRKWVACIS